MSQVKTAISIDEDIFNAINVLSKKNHISRSRLLETAAREWVRKENFKALTAQINKALAGDRPGTTIEKNAAITMKRQYRKLLEKW